MFQKVSRACVRWTEKENVPVLSAGWASVGRSGESSHVASVFGFSETKLQSGRRGGERERELAKKGSLARWCVSVCIPSAWEAEAGRAGVKVTLIT